MHRQRILRTLPNNVFFKTLRYFPIIDLYCSHYDPLQLVIMLLYDPLGTLQPAGLLYDLLSYFMTCYPPPLAHNTYNIQPGGMNCKMAKKDCMCIKIPTYHCFILGWRLSFCFGKSHNLGHFKGFSRSRLLSTA